MTTTSIEAFHAADFQADMAALNQLPAHIPLPGGSVCLDIALILLRDDFHDDAGDLLTQWREERAAA
jgi:hypothetical protein